MRKRLREGSLNDKEIEVTLSEAKAPVDIVTPPGMEEMAEQLKGLFSNMGSGRKATRKLKMAEALKALADEEAARPGQRGRDPNACGPQRRAERHRLHRRDRQSGGAGQHPGRRRLAPGCAARPAATGRGHHRPDQARHGQDGPHAVHRLRRLPPGQAQRPDPGQLQGRFPIRVELQALSVADFEGHPGQHPCQPDPPSTRRCWPPRGSRSTSRPTASGAWPRSLSKSTSAPRTSGRAGWPR